MMQINVSGMTCDHCVSAVSKAVKTLRGVTDVAVDLKQGLVTVRGNADAAAIRKAITEEGYEVADAALVEDRGAITTAPIRRRSC
jgi:copper chaperone